MSKHKHVLIIEHTCDKLDVLEPISNRNDRAYTLGGTFTEFGVKNRNERIYTPEKFIPALNELKTEIETLGVVYGEYDHPESFETSMKRVSHFIKTLDYRPEQNMVYGQIKITPSQEYGARAAGLVEEGLPIFVSSRAAGVTENDNLVSIKKLFTYDIVASPGFASAKVSMNESLGFTNESNFRIYEISDESKINQLFNMNKNDLVTKAHLSDYSKYLISEIQNTQKKVNESIKSGKVDTETLNKLLEYYESVQHDYNKIVGYLDYLHEHLQISLSKNEKLEQKTSKIIEHTDYLADVIEKSIEYTEYIAENLDKSIEYSEYIAENLDKSIEYSEYIAENLDKSIEYSEYIAENLDKSIEYSEYIAENLDKSIEYSEYIAENLDKSIEYGEYIAENLDKSILYTKSIATKLNETKKLNENFDENDEDNFAQPEDFGFEVVDTTTEEEPIDEFIPATETDVNTTINDVADINTENSLNTDDTTVDNITEEPINHETEETVETEEVVDSTEDLDNIPHHVTTEKKTLSDKIDLLIAEAKKRKAAETNDIHFLSFLTKSQVDAFYEMESIDRETIVSYISENKKTYFSAKDVLILIDEALSAKNEPIEVKLIKAIPESIKPTWDKLDEGAKNRILNQSKLHPDLTSDLKIEHFWLTRDFSKVITNENKALLQSDVYSENNTLSNEAIEAIMKKYRGLN